MRAKTAEWQFSLDGNRARFFNSGADGPLRIMIVADTHLSIDDERGLPYRGESARMAGHNKGAKDLFVSSMRLAKTEGFDLIALLGDIVSFPSEAGVEFAKSLLDGTGVPFIFTAGNHDWHYEGLPGTGCYNNPHLWPVMLLWD
jgi:predicted MPP superfamily phosphohydrolase